MSTENIKNRINMNGLYRHKPDIRYSRHDDLYWCQNWTFRPHEYDGKIYMYDTYWGSGGLVIEVTEDNIDEFTLIFDFDEVEEFNFCYIEEFGEQDKDWFIVPVNSSGLDGSCSFIRKGAKRKKDLVIKRKIKEIEEHQHEIDRIKRYIDELKTGEREPSDFS